MRKIDSRCILKILLIVLKVILAIPLAAAFILIRCIQYFLKISGTVVSFVCMLSSVVVALAALMEVVLQIQGNGPGVAAIVLTICVSGALIYVPVAGVGLVMVILEAGFGVFIWEIPRTGRPFTKDRISSGRLLTADTEERIRRKQSQGAIILKV